MIYGKYKYFSHKFSNLEERHAQLFMTPIEPQYDMNNWSLTAYEHEPSVLNNMFDFP